MATTAEARLILKYFGTVNKAASTVGQRAMTGSAGGPLAGSLPKAVVEHVQPQEAKAFMAFMRPNPITFYPAQMRMAM